MRASIRKLIPPSFLSLYHLAFAFFSAVRFGFPGYKLHVIGVTGTNGKSTTVDMMARIFQEAGYKVASLSSIRFQLIGKEWQNKLKMTMPGRSVIQKFMRQALQEGCTHFVLEVTSEGILQHRHRFIRFETAVFANLSPEHIERHGSFEKYREAKGKLFEATHGVHVINMDDEHAPYFLRFPAQKTCGYSISGETKDSLGLTKAEDVREDGGLRFRVEGVEVRLNLLGRFNVSNALAAIAVARSYGISLSACKAALEKIQEVPGRMQTVVSAPFRVIVDYAFTPAALEKVYKTLKTTNYKLICVLGAAGGGRDTWKRPVLGGLAGAYCDTVIVTNEDPYEEKPADIIEQVAKGAESIGVNQPDQRTSAVLKILDRREAIRKGLTLASSGDTVIITGKGSEDSIAVAGGKKIPWDDRQVVQEEFRKIASSH